jgi:hypothetical protein
MVAELEARGVDPGGREKLFEELVAARSDVSQLTPSQLLVKDMKMASGVPVPGLPVLVEVGFGCFMKHVFFFFLYYRLFNPFAYTAVRETTELGRLVNPMAPEFSFKF